MNCNRNQIREISATRLHILRIQTRFASGCCHSNIIDILATQNRLLFTFQVSILRICVLGISLAVFPLRAVLVFPGLVHVGDELREVNGNLITHKRPDEISQILVINVESD